ncbi:hypothetical protein Cob_v009320 [Colletotrichum orbiculare MAFF 240422]|uniref:Uncharacterized protein n=1 Tax=Colletotrichum orbiculare (strain 104-T / ATCC 96160 / CBS 514.97 / LARS 414 / MAFF 240422) TaxID=1213857 RepID=A0A484FLJ0_COLOR|nr:hypothetical protein Cob_v009320 [Colletotrichum orbiculare MAFF 240422]
MLSRDKSDGLIHSLAYMKRQGGSTLRAPGKEPLLLRLLLRISSTVFAFRDDSLQPWPLICLCFPRRQEKRQNRVTHKSPRPHLRCLIRRHLAAAAVIDSL